MKLPAAAAGYASAARRKHTSPPLWGVTEWKKPFEWINEATVTVLDPKSEQRLGHRGAVPDGGLLAAGQTLSTTQVFDTRTGTRVARLSDPPKRGVTTAADHVAFSPDGRQLATAKHKKLEVVRVKDWQPAWAHPGHPPQIAGIAYTPDGKLLATASGKSVVFWGAGDGKRKLELTGHKKMVHGPAIAADGSFVATPGEDGVVMLWKLPSGKRYAQYTGHEDKVFHVILSADGRTAASYDYNSELHLWDTETQRQIGKLDAEAFMGVVFSPDGKWLVVPGFEVRGRRALSEPLRVVDARAGTVVAELEGAGEGVAFVGGRLAVSQGKRVVVFELRN